MGEMGSVGSGFVKMRKVVSEVGIGCQRKIKV